MTIVNDDTRVINKLETSLTDDARVIIYDRQRSFYLQLSHEQTSDDRMKPGACTLNFLRAVIYRFS